MTIKASVFIGDQWKHDITAEHLDEYDLLAPWDKSGSGPITLDRAHPAVRYLNEKPAWVRVEHDGALLFTAAIERDRWPFGDSTSTARTYVLRDHWALLERVPALIAPENRIAPDENEAGLSQLAQVVATGPTTPGTVTNLSGYFVWVGDTAETAVRDIVTRNLTALGIAHRWASVDQGRGADPSFPDVRMGFLAQAIVPVLTAAGLRITVHREGNEYVLDIVEPGEYEPYLTSAGPLGPGWAERNRLGITDLIHGGPGRDAARAWFHATDEELAAEQDFPWFDFRDGTGYSPVWEQHLHELAKEFIFYLSRSDADVLPVNKDAWRSYRDQDIRKAFADGAPTASLQVELRQAGGFVFPTGYQLGTRLNMTETVTDGEPDGPVFHDRVTAVRIQKARNGYETVTPQIGSAPQSAAARMRADIAKLAAASLRLTIQR